jgi:hypothetical protein
VSYGAPVRTAKPPGERPVTLTLRQVVAAPRLEVASLLLADWHAWSWLSSHSLAPMHVMPSPHDAMPPRTECGHVAAGATRVVVRHTAASFPWTNLHALLLHRDEHIASLLLTPPHRCSASSVAQPRARVLLMSLTACGQAAWDGGTPSVAAAAAAPWQHLHGMLTLQSVLLPSCLGATR